MKKIAIFVITLSLCLSLAACNADKSSKDSSINFVFNKHIIIDESNNLSIIGGE